MEWYSPENKPDYNKDIIMKIETQISKSTHQIYIAGRLHSDDVLCESCGGSLDQEFDNYKLLAWAYIIGPNF